MAGTRLLTQVSFILGVLILLVPPSLYVHHVHRAAFPTTLPFSNTTTFYHPTINIQVYIATTTATPLDWDQIRSATQDVKGLVAFPGEQPLSAPPDHVDEVSLEGWLKSLSPSFNVPSSPATYTLVLLPANRQVSERIRYHGLSHHRWRHQTSKMIHFLFLFVMLCAYIGPTSQANHWYEPNSLAQPFRPSLHHLIIASSGRH